MTGKAYYLATFGVWRQHASHFANSHFVVLSGENDESPGNLEGQQGTVGPICASAFGDDTPIVILVEADEGAHLKLEDDPTITQLPQTLAQKVLPESVQKALAGKGVPPGATTFDAAETLAKIHPLLRYRVF